ncbi:unnamed protein product [Acanthoscelides obtectus]|uniref:Uncharacterized protein n=1 Tax=Acanthoscelides obtectus TaxID=200917 RepID=A0A9P0PPF9_ACAOB|nr:unnamed protein product [Acanthoscelides obtectus]CAK1674293.1 hypothetical protein AOBTE_LOCUS29582 [Acanthoscelides obtectus]
MGQQTPKKGWKAHSGSFRGSTGWTQLDLSFGSFIWRTTSKGERSDALPHAAQHRHRIALPPLQER